MPLSTPEATALNRALQRWMLTRPFLLVETGSSFVYRVELPDGTPAALKLLKPDTGGDEARGGALLAWYDGQGAARIYGLHDEAVLMQWIDGESLGDLARSGRDAAATEILCDVVASLHAGREAPPPELTPLRQRFGALFGLPSRAWPPRARDLVGRATGVAYGLFDKWMPQLPLHGDIHHDNIFRSGDDWLAIDPKGLLGDPAYDYANSFLNPERADEIVLSATRVARHSATLSERTGIERKRLLAWAAAHAALSAAWDIEDGNPVTHQVSLLPLLLTAYDAA